MSTNSHVTLNNGVKMPLIGLGTWRSKTDEVRNAVTHALKHGYRHLDLAKVYLNQGEVATGIKDSGVDRKDIFITSKLWNTWHKPELVEKGLDDTLHELQTEYLDLYLIHFPISFAPTLLADGSYDPTILKPVADGRICLDHETTFIDTWKEMIKLRDSGKVRAIGVSNCTPAHIERLIEATGVTPSVNQVERHPLLPQTSLLEYCNSKGIHVTAYSPLGNNILGKMKIVDYPQVISIADRLRADPAQVLIAWSKKAGVSVIPKSITPSRIETNFKEIEISDEDYTTICQINGGEEVRFNIPVTYVPSWEVNLFDTDIEKQSALFQVNLG